MVVTHHATHTYLHTYLHTNTPQLHPLANPNPNTCTPSRMQKAQLKTCAPSLLHFTPHTHPAPSAAPHLPSPPTSHSHLRPPPSYTFSPPTPTHSSMHTFTPQPAFLEKSRAAAGGEAVRHWGQPVLGGEKEAPRAHSLTTAESCRSSTAGEGVEAVW